MQNFAEKFVQFDFLLYFCRLDCVRMPAPPASTHKINNDWKLLNFKFNMKLKQSIKFLTFLLIALVTSINFVWADGETPDGQTVYLAAFKAQSSAESTGSGTVKLTWVDAQGQLFDNTAVSFLNTAMPYATGNPSNSDAFASTAMVVGATLTATESVEDSDPKSLVNNVLRTMMFNAGADSSHLFMTPFAYFKADAQADAGSYFAGWTFNDARVWQQDTAMDKSAPESAYFKVLPNSANVFYMTPPATVTGLETAYTGAVSNPNNLYAVFKRYLLSNPTSTSAQLEASEGETATLNVTLDVEGDLMQYKENYADFVFPSLPGTVFFEDTYGSWSWNLARNPYAVGPTTMRAEVTVTYTAKAGITPGAHTANITVSMAGPNPSSLTIPLSVNALDPARLEALWFDGKTQKNQGDLDDMLVANIEAYADPILRLNKPVSVDLTFSGRNFTLDLNGNAAQAVTISSGNVTIAYSKYGGTATSLTVNGGKAILNGGTFGALTIGTNGMVEQNGATITGAATNNGTLTTTAGLFNGGLTSSKSLILNGGTFNGTNAVVISGGTANINKGTLNGTSCGLLVSGGIATTKKLAVINSEGTYSAKQESTGTLNVECGKFGKPLNGTINFTSGYFKNQDYGVSAEGKTEMLISTGVEYNEGYRYFLGTDESALANGVGVCRIGSVSYSTLEDALAYANNKPNEELVIFMTNDYILPAGYYTLPAKATLVVPMSDEQAKEVNKTAPRLVYNDVQNAPENRYANNPLVEYRRLTFASGVNMDVFGDIEMTGTQYSTNEAYTSQPVGPYGHLFMEEGSHLTLQSGAEIRAWGFMTGKGETDARRGSTVREMFQMGDWKGAMTSVKITGMVPADFPISIGDDSDKKIFPVTQYFIQNVESPVKYHPGALLSTSAAVSEGISALGSVSMTATDIAIVGVDGVHTAIFLMDNEADADNTWVRKWYDVENDVQTYDINSGAHIGSMELNLGSISLMGYTLPVRLNSAKFDLPLTCNFKIHLLSGTMDFKQNTCLLPGAEVEVDKESIVSVAKSDSDPDHTGALYVYDNAEWDKYAYCNEIDAEGQSHKSTAYTKVVRYSPSWNGRPTKRQEQTKPDDAAINVHGTFNTDAGFVYTSESGANIFSSNADAGTFIFNDNAADAGTRLVYNVKGVGTFESLTFYPAKLKNGIADPAYVNTDAAVAGDAYCYIDNEWTTMYPDGDNPCFMVKHNVNGDVYFAKPAEYVQIVATKTAGEFSGNSDHTYSDAAGAGRLFILTGESDGSCQWWEVEKKDNFFHCIHPENDTYYEWDGSEWVEKTFTISWKNWDGTPVYTTDADGDPTDKYVVTYGTMAEFLGTNPTREADIDYTYDFIGWSPELAPVTSNVTYTATYEQKERKYTITFLQEGGVEIERQFLPHNAVPVCENAPTKVGHILTWTPAISPVIKDQDYTATWLDEPPTTWEVQFTDYDGTVLTKTDNSGLAVFDVPVNGTISAADLALVPTPTGKNDNESGREFGYEFDHWQPATTDPVTQPTIYTAIYREVAKQYTVIFRNEDNSEIERHDYAYGATPVCSNLPTKTDPTGEWTYNLAWMPQIQSIVGNVDLATPIVYTADFETYKTKNKYTVTLRSNNDAVCTFTGAGIHDYGTKVTISAIVKDGYEFVRWEERAGGADLGEITITEDITLTAVVKTKDVDVANKTVGIGEEFDGTGKEVMDLVIQSNGVASGQVKNADKLKVDGNVYFDLALGAAGRTWYAFGLPWKVSTSDGISVNGRTLTMTEDFYLAEFDAAACSAGDVTNNYWKYVTAGAILQPAKLYMIYLRNNASTIRFTKVTNMSVAPIVNTTITLDENPSTVPTRAGWNAIANPTTNYAQLTSTAIPSGKGQKYVPGEDRYEVFELTEQLAVGRPLFVQVSTGKTMVANGSNQFAAPKRAVKTSNEYEIRIAPANADFTDRIYISTCEEKEDRYLIGQDLSKISVATGVAQMWINRYDAKLCVNTTELSDNQAIFPIGIFVPTTGQYTISAATLAIEDEDIFVTVNGIPVWNLTQGAYTIDLTAGNTDAYGLLVVYHPAPEISTGCDQLESIDKPSVRKVLINGQVYILRDGAVYTIFGQKAK